MVWVVVALRALVACAGEPDEERVAFCEGYCAKIRECRLDPSGTCEQYCLEYEASTTSRSEFLDAMVPCTRRASCDDIDSGDFYSKCYDEAGSATEARDEDVSGCERLIRSDLECGYGADFGSCVDNMKVLKSGVVSELVVCSESDSCEARSSCYEGVYQ
jgi:hypothetical protein